MQSDSFECAFVYIFCMQCPKNFIQCFMPKGICPILTILLLSFEFFVRNPLHLYVEHIIMYNPLYHRHHNVDPIQFITYILFTNVANFIQPISHIGPF